MRARVESNLEPCHYIKYTHSIEREVIPGLRRKAYIFRLKSEDKNRFYFDVNEVKRALTERDAIDTAYIWDSSGDYEKLSFNYYETGELNPDLEEFLLTLIRLTETPEDLYAETDF
jgi:hypothetical protein